MKPFAIGRKNYLFFGSDRGGRTLATLASLTAACQQFGVNPWTWLRDTLAVLPVTPADQLATLLPTPTAKEARIGSVPNDRRPVRRRTDTLYPRLAEWVKRP